MPLKLSAIQVLKKLPALEYGQRIFFFYKEENISKKAFKEVFPEHT